MKPLRQRPYQPKKFKKHKGLVIVYTGNGKGKTTAALGLALRAAGNRMKVAVVQFIKGNWKCGELAAAKRLRPYLEIEACGRGFTWETKSCKADIQSARKTWELAKHKINSRRYKIVILDEINYAMSYGFLDVKEVVRFLKKKPVRLHVVLTGRNAPPALIKIADLVTEMREIKHPFRLQRLLAQRGIDF